MDLRQELERVFRGLNWYENNIGETVLWHEYDAVQSEIDDTYDEGGKVYRPALHIPALWVIVSEDERRRAREGRKPTDSIALAVSARSFDLSGLSDPEDSARHLNDVIRYDNRLWTVDSFNIRGRIPTSVVIGITGTQIFAEEELSIDSLPPGSTVSGTGRTYPYPNLRQQEWPDHELPARNGETIDTDALYKNFDTTW